MKNLKRGLCVLILLIYSLCNIAVAENDSINIEDVIKDSADYIQKTVKEPKIGSIGGEWTIIGLARSGVKVPAEYYQKYYSEVEEYVKEHKGILHDKKYTEYSRLIVALTSIGKNPEDVAGYNLLMPLADYENTIRQGLNGPIWALIALDCGNYEIPQNSGAKVLATRRMYVERILECQLADGGWSLLGKLPADPDMTGMAIQALSKYRDDEKVEAAINRALGAMSEKQDENGGFSSWSTENSESCVQILVALCELGISADDERFVKNGNTIIDNLLGYYNNGNGFFHTLDGNGSNLMATEQAFYGFVALDRMNKGKNSLYNMSDAIFLSEDEDGFFARKNDDVKKTEILAPNKTFSDIQGHFNQKAIEELASRNIITGKSEQAFEPDSTMTRAEFATITVRGLGLPIKNEDVFSDVYENDWFRPFVNTAYAYKIVNGVSENEFNPYGIITREEAAVMISRAALLCGMETEIETFEVRNILAEFLDYVKASEWARSSLAFCYDEEILPRDVMEIKPKEAVTRAEIAQMLFNMLKNADLI